MITSQLRGIEPTVGFQPAICYFTEENVYTLMTLLENQLLHKKINRAKHFIRILLNPILIFVIGVVS